MANEQVIHNIFEITSKLSRIIYTKLSRVLGQTNIPDAANIFSHLTGG